MRAIFRRYFSFWNTLVVATSLFALLQCVINKPALFAQAAPELTSAPDTLKAEALNSVDEKQAAKATNKPSSSAELYALGIDQLKNGEAEAAVESFEGVLSANPSHVKSMVNLSRAYLELERYVDAETMIDRAVVEEPSNAQAHLVRGRVRQSIGNSEGAILSYQESIELEEQNPFAYNNLALIYIQDGRFREAIPLLQKAIGQKHDVVYFHNNLGIAYEGIGDLMEAEDAFQQALDLEPGYAKALTNLERTQDKQAQQPQKGPVGANGADNDARKAAEKTGAKKDSTRQDKIDG